MDRKLLLALARGGIAGAAGTVIQTVIGKSEGVLLLPPDEDADIAPRLVERLGETIGEDPSPPVKWLLGTAFHFGYGITWGMGYAALRERIRIHPLVGGALLGGVIYAITWPRWGGAVQTGTGRPPRERSESMEVVAASVSLGYGLATALLDEALRERIR